MADFCCTAGIFFEAVTLQFSAVIEMTYAFGEVEHGRGHTAEIELLV